MKRIGKVQRGKFDDVITWLGQLTDFIVMWREGRPVPTASYTLIDISEYDHVVTKSNWIVGIANPKTKDRVMHWIHAYEARNDLIAVMERQPISPDWDTHLANVQACRRYLQQHNPLADDGWKS